MTRRVRNRVRLGGIALILPSLLLPFPADAAPAPVNCAVAKCVALTYDDGPGAHTDRLLDILGREKVKATFFMTGKNVDKKPKTVRRMRDMGMQLGNHTTNHRDLTKQKQSVIRKEISGTQASIKKASGGVTPTVFRPPYGARNATVDRIAKEQGVSVVLWDVDPLDWRDRNTSVVTQRVLANTKPRSIVLLHDIHGTSVDATPAIIAGLKKNGYTLVTVAELRG